MFGVVITAYNCEKFIRASLLSVFDQTLKPSQVIVVDNASNDGTDSILRELQKKYGFSLITHSENMERVFSRNEGAKFLKTEYVCFLDCDDFWGETYLESLKSLVEKEQPDAIYSAPKGFIDKRGKIIKLKKTPKEDFETLLYEGRVGYPTGSCFKRETFLKTGGYSQKYLHREDWEIFLRFHIKGLNIAFKQQGDYFIREHIGRSSRKNPKFLEATLEIFKNYYPLLKGENKALIKYHTAVQCLRFNRKRCGYKLLSELIKENPKIFKKPKRVFEVLKRLI
jgi:glycosyltransferase involved in cell wall biosynthesis